MAEYIDREKLIPDRCYYEPYGYEAVSCEQIFHENTADVVERSEYDKMVLAFKERVENQKNNLIATRDAYYQIEKEYVELHSKIDKAYKKMEDLFNTSLEECPLSEVSFRCGLSYAMDILAHDVGVGENNNENTERME